MMKRFLLCLCLCLWSLPAKAADTQRGLNADTTSASTALGALNAACTLATSGQTGAGFQLAAGTLVGTIVPEISIDNGATWVTTQFDDPVTSNKVASIVFGSSNTATTRAIVLSGGTRQVRVRVSLYTSGTANCTIVSSAANDPSVLFSGAAAVAVPQDVAQVGGKDGSGNLQPIQITAKGVQPSVGGQATQDLKDSGRSQIMLSWEEMTGTAAAESALTNFTLGSKAGVALSAATNYTVTAAKTLRIQEVTIYVKATSTVNNLARFRIRQAASSIANTSPVIFDKVIALDAPGTIAANLTKTIVVPIPDGLEVAATQQITFTWFTSANTCTTGMSITGYEY